MIRLINAELFKLRKRSMTRILLFVMIGIIVILYFLLLAIRNVTFSNATAAQHTQGIGDLLGLRLALPFAMAMLASFGSVMAIILIASLVGNEYSWRTVRTMVISSESRMKLLGAKLIASSAYILLGMVIVLATGFVMSLITTAIGGYKFDFSFAAGSYFWDQFVQLWRTFYIMLPYVLLAFLFAVVGRSAMAGIAVSIGVLFLESIITALMYVAGGWVANIPAYLINANFTAINNLNSLPGGLRGSFGSSAIPSPTVMHAVITLGIYIVVFLAVAFYLFRKRDVTV